MAKLIRITGGRHKGRGIPSPNGDSIRPTSSMAREGIFNILRHFAPLNGADLLQGAIVLDMYSGSGIMSFEALSRGAEHVTLMDANSAALAQAKSFAAKIGESANLTFIRADCTKPPLTHTPAGIIFLDPPYSKQLAAKTITAATASGWAGVNTIIIAEHHRHEPLEAVGYNVIKTSEFGISRFSFLMQRN